MTSEPRLMYYKKGDYGGDINICSEMGAEEAGKDRFDLITPRGTFHFKVYPNDSAKEWVVLITKVVRDFAMK